MFTPWYGPSFRCHGVALQTLQPRSCADQHCPLPRMLRGCRVQIWGHMLAAGHWWFSEKTWCIYVSLYFHHAFPRAGNKIALHDVWSSPLFSWLIQTFGNVLVNQMHAWQALKSGSSRGRYIGNSELDGCSMIQVTFFFRRYSSLSCSSITMNIEIKVWFHSQSWKRTYMLQDFIIQGRQMQIRNK